MGGISKIILASSLNWIKATELPEQQGDKSVEVIMMFDDGFVSRGYYDFSDCSWYGYNTHAIAEKYFCNPDYYILL